MEITCTTEQFWDDQSKSCKSCPDHSTSTGGKAPTCMCNDGFNKNPDNGECVQINANAGASPMLSAVLAFFVVALILCVTTIALVARRAKRSQMSQARGRGLLAVDPTSVL